MNNVTPVGYSYSDSFGVFLSAYLTIGDIQLPAKIKDAMQMQVEADRRKRAAILESEGQRDAEINRAEGIKQRQILSSEGQRVEMINKATGEFSLLFTLFRLFYSLTALGFRFSSYISFTSIFFSSFIIHLFIQFLRR